MSKKKISSTIDYLSDPRKGITAAILLVIVLVAVVWVSNKIRKLWRSSSLKSGLDDAAIEAAAGSSITASLNFRQLATRLWDATCAYTWGTNEQEVFAVLGCLNTQADYIKLSNAWAESYNATGWWNRNIGTLWQARSTLAGVLQSELTKKELNQARSILTDKGITPDF